MKRCCCCKEHKPQAAFQRNRCTKDGLQARCKACQTAAISASRAQNPGPSRAACLRWQARNREQRNAYQRARTEALVDAYVAESLGLRKATAPEGLVEAQRLHLQITRFLKEKTK